MRKSLLNRSAGWNGLRVALVIALAGVPARAVKGAPAQPAGRVPVAEAIRVDPGASCLDRESLVPVVVAWLGAPELDGRLRVEVRGDPEVASTAHFRILRGGTVIAERSFEPGPEACPDLHAVVGLAIALAIDATVLESLGADPRDPPPSEPLTPPRVPPAGPQPKEPDNPAPAPAIPARRGLGVRAAMEPAFLLEVVPGLGVGGRARVALTPRPQLDVRLALEVGYGPAQPFPGTDGALSSVLVAGRVDVCGARAFAAARVYGCAGAAGGALQAHGHGFTDNASTTLPWVALVLGMGTAIDIAPAVFIGVGADVYVPLVRPRVTVRGSAADTADPPQVSRSMAPVAGAFFAGPGLRFR